MSLVLNHILITFSIIVGILKICLHQQVFQWCGIYCEFQTMRCSPWRFLPNRISRRLPFYAYGFKWLGRACLCRTNLILCSCGTLIQNGSHLINSSWYFRGKFPVRRMYITWQMAPFVERHHEMTFMRFTSLWGVIKRA